MKKQSKTNKTYTYWSSKENDILRKLYGKNNEQLYKKLPNRSKLAIHLQAKKLKLTRPRVVVLTDFEKNILNNFYHFNREFALSFIEKRKIHSAYSYIAYTTKNKKSFDWTPGRKEVATQEVLKLLTRFVKKNK